LAPFTVQPLPLRAAVVLIAATSDPDSGSVSAKAAIRSPAATEGR